MAKAKKLPSGNWRVNLYDYTDPATGKRIYKSFTATTKKKPNTWRQNTNWTESSAPHPPET